MNKPVRVCFCDPSVLALSGYSIVMQAPIPYANIKQMAIPVLKMVLQQSRFVGPFYGMNKIYHNKKGTKGTNILDGPKMVHKQMTVLSASTKHTKWYILVMFQHIVNSIAVAQLQGPLAIRRK